MDRREFIVASTAGFLNIASAEAHDTGKKHKHGGPASGTGSHLPGFESSFDRGSLQRMFNNPRCILIIHHANLAKHSDFEVVDLGREQYPVWVNEDAPISSLRLSDIKSHYLESRAIYSSSDGEAKFYYNKLDSKKPAYVNLLARHGIPADLALQRAEPLLGYNNMYSVAMGSRSAVLIGFRKLPFNGLKVLRVNEKHPVFDFENYPLWTETYAYIRKSSSTAYSKFDLYMQQLGEERQLDENNWTNSA